MTEDIATLRKRAGNRGLGTWALGGLHTLGGRSNGWSTVDLSLAKQTLAEAYERGIRFFDTAPGYGNRASEAALGEVFAGVSDLVICTKYGVEERDGAVRQNYGPDALLSSVELSLKALKRECLDIILLHNPLKEMNFSQFDPKPFEQLVHAGKIKHYGVSCNNLETLRNLLEAGFGSVIEFRCNVMSQEYLATYRDALVKRDHFVIARSILASGLLTEQWYSRGTSFAASDHRATYPQSYLDSVRQMIAQLKKSHARPVEEVALEFVSAQSEIDMILLGGHRPHHLTLLT